MKNLLPFFKIIAVLFLLVTAPALAQETVPGTALEFDGTEDYVNCGNDTSLSFGGTAPFTIEMWVKPNDNLADGIFFSKINWGNSGEYKVGVADGVVFFTREVAPWDVYATTVLQQNTWYHVAAVYNSSNMIIYINGNEENSIYAPGSMTATSHDVLIGAHHHTGTLTDFFNGVIEELRVWDIARTTDEIRENMHLTLSGSETGLVSYWQFNEAGGNTAFDPVSGNNGTLIDMSEADWITSTVPVGGGSSFSQIVNTTGIFDFTDTGLSMDFTAKSGTDTIVVSKLDLSPNITPSSYSTFDSQYWIVNKFGSGTFNTNLTFTPNETITPDDESSPDALRLLNRQGNSDGSWSNMMGASAASISNNTVTYDSISAFSQFLIGRQWFTDIAAGLTGVCNSSVAWGDYDNDGDLDIIVTGWDGSNSFISRIYQNNSGIFADINAGLIEVYDSSVAWGDYDNDGDLDILLTGNSGSSRISRIYRNDAGIFTDIEAGLTGAFTSSVAWGDYDNDGDLDILLTGSSFSGAISHIYRNDQSADGPTRVFTDINAGLIGVYNSSVAWGDYDNDGDLDILLTGYSFSGETSHIYRNDGPSTGSGYIFTDINAGLTGFGNGSAAWGDYDNDGDLDILLTGADVSYNPTSRIYQNNSGVFTDINAGLIGAVGGSTAWGDYDNDGDLDVLLSGFDASYNCISRIYHNNSGIFTDINAALAGVFNSSVAWGDYNNNGNLDILITGGTTLSAPHNPIFRIYRNNYAIHNTAPFSPDGLSAGIFADSLTFSWNKANDNETPQNGLSYNFVLGNSDYGALMNSPMADINNGYRLISAFVNVCQDTSWTYQIPKLYTYPYPQVMLPDYWGVQAIDHAFAGSAFSTSSLDFPIYYLYTINDSVMQFTDTLAWEITFLDSIINFQIQIDDDSTFSNCEVNELLSVLPKDSTYFSIHLQYLYGTHNLVPGAKYYWRIKPNYTFGSPTVFTDPAPSFWFGYETGIEDEPETAIPQKFALQQNYPNPFNPVTVISYQLPVNSEVELSIFNTLGQKVATLVSKPQTAGYYTVNWNASSFPSGVYFYRIKAGNFTDMKKMIFVK